MKFRDISVGDLTWGENLAIMHLLVRDQLFFKNKSPLPLWEWELDYINRAGPAFPWIHDVVHMAMPVTQTGEQP
jgi:hypothetical protein